MHMHVHVLASSFTAHLYTGLRDPPLEDIFAGQLACVAAVPNFDCIKSLTNKHHRLRVGSGVLVRERGRVRTWASACAFNIG